MATPAQPRHALSHTHSSVCWVGWCCLPTATTALHDGTQSRDLLPPTPSPPGAGTRRPDKSSSRKPDHNQSPERTVEPHDCRPAHRPHEESFALLKCPCGIQQQEQQNACAKVVALGATTPGQRLSVLQPDLRTGVCLCVWFFTLPLSAAGHVVIAPNRIWACLPFLELTTERKGLLYVLVW